MDSGPLARLGTWLEELLLGQSASLYRQFVRALMIVTGVLAVLNALILVDLLPVSATLAGAIWTAGGVAVGLFVLAGIIQAVVLARAYERGTQEVAQTAAEIETAAEAVAETAEDLETAAEDVETAADEVESAVPATEGGDVADAPTDPDVVADDARERVDQAKARADRAKSTAETVEETASEVKETAAEQREHVPGGPENAPEPTEGTDLDADSDEQG